MGYAGIEHKFPVGSGVDINFQRRMLLDGVGGSEPTLCIPHISKSIPEFLDGSMQVGSIHSH